MFVEKNIWMEVPRDLRESSTLDGHPWRVLVGVSNGDLLWNGRHGSCGRTFFREVFDERRLLVLRRCNADLFLDDGAKSRMCT